MKLEAFWKAIRLEEAGDVLTATRLEEARTVLDRYQVQGTFLSL